MEHQINDLEVTCLMLGIPLARCDTRQVTHTHVSLFSEPCELVLAKDGGSQKVGG